MIRQARMADFKPLMDMWDEGYGDTPYLDMKINVDVVGAIFHTAVNNEEAMFCKVVEKDGEVCGLLMGIIDVNIWGVPTAQALISYSRHETDKLIRQFTVWAKERGAKQVTLTTVSGKPIYEKIATGLKFKEVGKLYSKEI